MMMTTERDMHRVTKRRYVEDHAAYAADAVTRPDSQRRTQCVGGCKNTAVQKIGRLTNQQQHAVKIRTGPGVIASENQGTRTSRRLFDPGMHAPHALTSSATIASHLAISARFKDRQNRPVRQANRRLPVCVPAAQDPPARTGCRPPCAGYRSAAACPT